jgi:hypothetical protein
LLENQARPVLDFWPLTSSASVEYLWFVVTALVMPLLSITGAEAADVSAAVRRPDAAAYRLRPMYFRHKTTERPFRFRKKIFFLDFQSLK